MDNAIGLGIVLSLRDQASAGLNAIRNKLTALRDVSQAMIKQFDAGAKQMITGFASMVAGSKVLDLIPKMFGASVDTAVDFEQAMARVGAVSGATGEDFERLSQQARDLGRETQFSASQAAASQENLARAGFKTNEIINAMPGLLNMAAAEGMDLANAADIASSAIRGFGLDASEANRVADVLAKTSSASNTSIALLGESLKYVAPLAKGLGFSIEQTNAMLGVMANAGIKGSQAGTSLKAAFQRLSEEPKRVSKALASLGVKAKTAQGDLRPLPELMKDIAAKTQGMGKGDKIGILSKIFGGVASSGMLAIMDGVANGSLPELEAALYGCSGAAQQMAERMNATAKGAMLRLESASEGLRIVIGNHLLPIYTWVIDTMAEFKSWLTQLIEAHPVLAKIVIGFTTTLIALAGSVLLVVGALSAIGGMIKMWPLMKSAATFALMSIRTQTVSAVSSFAGLKASLLGLSLPMLGLVGLAAWGFYAWRKNLWGVRDIVEAVVEGFKMAWSASTEGFAEVDDALAARLQKTGIWDYAVSLGKIFFRVRKLWQGFVEGINDNIKVIRSAFAWVKDIFSPVIESGQELLHFLGILKPAAESQVDTWQTYGLWVGRVTPSVLTLYAALKMFGKLKAITGIFGGMSKVAGGLIGLITAHPVAAAVVAIVAALAGLAWAIYKNWDSVKAFFARTWQKISDYGVAAVNWVKAKWKGFSDWWNSWSIWDVFSPVKDYAAEAEAIVKQKWTDLQAWWNSWTFADIFAPVKEYAGLAKDYAIQKLTDLKTWWDSWTLSDVFSPVLEKGRAVWDSFSSTIETVKNLASEKLSGIWDKTVTAYEQARNMIVGKVISPVLEFSWNALVDGWNLASGLVSSGFEKLKGFLHIDFSGFWDTLSSGFSTVCDSLKGAWNGVTGFIKDTWNTAADYVSDAWKWTKGLFGYDTDAEDLQTQLQDITALNKMSEGFSQRVAEMTQAWQPFKASLAEGFEQIYAVMQGIADRINGIVIPAVNALVSSLSRVAAELASIAQAGNLSLNVNVPPQAKSAVLSQSANLAPSYMKALPAPASNAQGGIYSSPILTWAAENGSEAIIPLNDKSYGVPLWYEAGRELGLILPTAEQKDSLSSHVNVMNSIIPHAEGGIFSQPHIGLVAEAGREAVIPLENKARGIPLLMAAASQIFGQDSQKLVERYTNQPQIMHVNHDQPYSMPLLSQLYQNQTLINEQHSAQLHEHSAASNSQVDVRVEVNPADVYIDGERVGRIAFRWNEHQNIRNGAGL